MLLNQICQKVMINNFLNLIPSLVLASHVVWIIIVLAIVFRNSWGRAIIAFIGRRALWLAFLTSIVAVVGSLFYSEIIGFEPCVLCWWQRIFLYPLVVIFGMAIWRKNSCAFLYAIPLAILAGIVSLYQSYVSLGGASLLPCTALGGACDKIYVMAFNYITIPMMGLTIASYILLFAWINKIFTADEDRNA